ncbi:MAG: hypothetical protein J0H68_06240 [Sphingobacteriia bacterium]|nr:hypothetical protein [Sphingobacteriia bacterium]
MENNEVINNEEVAVSEEANVVVLENVNGTEEVIEVPTNVLPAEVTVDVVTA